MALELIGGTAAVLQLVGTVSRSLGVLRDAHAAVKDVKKRIQETLDRVNNLETSIRFIKQYLELQPGQIEPDLQDVIRYVTTSCEESLTMIQNKLCVASGTRQRINAAVRLWIQDPDLEKAKKHIDGALQTLGLVLQVLHLYVGNLRWLCEHSS